MFLILFPIHYLFVENKIIGETIWTTKKYGRTFHLTYNKDDMLNLDRSSIIKSIYDRVEHWSQGRSGRVALSVNGKTVSLLNKSMF